MRVRRYGVVGGVEPLVDGSPDLRVTVGPEDPREWEDVPEGSTIVVEVEDTAGGLIRDMSRWRGNLSEEAVGQLRELRPRLLEFLDRARALEREESE